MWDKAIGKKTEHLVMLGISESPVYLLKLKDGWALMEGGLSALSGAVLDQLQATVGHLSEIKHWIITHSHYDHCGLVPYLSPLLSGVQIHAGSRVAAAFQSASARRVIGQLNAAIEPALLGAAPLDARLTAVGLETLPINHVRDGEWLQLDAENRFLVLATPGHSACSTSFYWEQKEILFVSDALGEITAAHRWLPLIFESKSAYEKSLSKLSEIPAKIIVPGHHGLLRGSLALTATADAARSLEIFAEAVQQARRCGQSVSHLASEWSQRFWVTCAKVVPADLHQKSMDRLVNLLASDLDPSVLS